MVFNLLHKAKTRHNTIPKIVVSGFFSILFLFSLILGISFYQNKATNEHISAIVELHGLKTELITQMYNAARERSMCLFSMVSLKDPFMRDEVYLKFNGYAAQFARARIRLKTVPLTNEEINLLVSQGDLTRITVPIQNQVADWAVEDKLPQASKLLIEKAVPLQDKVLTVLLELQNIQHKAAKQIATKNKQQQKDATYLSLVLIIVAVCIGAIIAIFVVRIIRSMEKKIFVAKDMAEITLNSIGDAVIVTNKTGVITQINPNAEALTGYTKEQAMGTEFYKIFNVNYESGDPRHELAEVLSMMRVISTADAPRVLVSSSGAQYSIDYTFAPVLDDDSDVNGAVITFRDVTEVRALSTKLKYFASHDSLTGLINRREFENHIKFACEDAANDASTHMLCFMDLEKFKIINDTAGHAAGDEFLKQVAQQIHSTIDVHDPLARLGGDEFGIIMHNCDESMAIKNVERIIEAVKNFRFVWANNVFDVGISIGMVKIHSASGTVAELLSQADTACYTAKNEGRNRVHIFDLNDEVIRKARGELEWLQQIKSALENDNLVLYVQPIVEISNNAQHHYEVLVRLYNEEKELVQPMSFIPTAERYGLMPDIDRWVVKNTIKFLSNTPQFNGMLTVNLSGQSVCDEHFYQFILDEFNSTRINPGKLCFEITETAAITNLSIAVTFIQSLKLLGCQFALDDFGSGLSSFSYLKNMAVDYIKIDGNFILDICEDETDFAFVEAINRIGKVMGIKTIAEFVENKEIHMRLKSIGVDYAQGFLFSRPEPIAVLEKTIKQFYS